MNLKKIEELEAEIAKLKAAAQNTKPLPEMIDIPKRNYAVAETPITVAQYKEFCDATDRKFPQQQLKEGNNYPIVNVSWHDATAYCKWLSEKTGDDYSLLTEDEFEYCCADHQEANEDIAVYEQNEIQPVKTKQPNKFGLYDMLGCVWEWQGD